MGFPENISTCARCEHRQRECVGHCPCTIDGVSDLDHAKANICPKGKYGQGMLGRMVAGAVKYVQATITLSPATEAVQQSRLATCAACPNVDGSVCKLCGCHLPKKTALKDERCPVGKWEAV
jgi:hypothetical protein